MTRKVYQRIAELVSAIGVCHARGNLEWQQRHSERLDNIIRDYLPSGGGWDQGTRLEPQSTPEKLVFGGAFHHLNDLGSYAGWSEHKIIVTPSLAYGFHLEVTGADRNDVKQMLHDTFHAMLNLDVAEDQEQA